MPAKIKVKDTAESTALISTIDPSENQNKHLYTSFNFFNYTNYKQQLLLIMVSLTGLGLSYGMYHAGQINSAINLVSNGYNYLTNFSSISLPILGIYTFFKATQPELPRYIHPENEALKTDLLALNNWGPAFADSNPHYLMKHDSPKSPAWQRSIQYGYFLHLINEQDKTHLLQKIKLLDKTVKNLNLLPLQQEVLSHTKILLVSRAALQGDDAITELTDGSIMLAFDLPEKAYGYYLNNELSHAMIRYVNLMRFGKEKLPKDRIRICLPYVNADWSINVEKRQAFINALEKGFARIMHLRDIYRKNPDSAELAAYHQQLKNFRPEYINAISAEKQQILGKSINDPIFLFVTYMDSIMEISTAYRKLGGLNYQIIEEISDIQSVLDWESQRYFFLELTELLEEFYDLSPIPGSNLYNLRRF